MADHRGRRSEVRGGRRSEAHRSKEKPISDLGSEYRELKDELVRIMYNEWLLVPFTVYPLPFTI